MKLVILTLFLSTTATTFGQTFKKDWLAFNNSINWTIIFFADSSSYLDKETQGQIHLKSKTDTTISLTYYVYLKSNIDSTFENKITNLMLVQSCGGYTSGKINFMSFDFKKYFYLLKPCHNCNIRTNRECEELAEKILKFILKK